MSRIIEILLDEHRNIKKLLHVLEQELEIFDRGESPDYEILQAIIDYFQDRRLIAMSALPPKADIDRGFGMLALCHKQTSRSS